MLVLTSQGWGLSVVWQQSIPSMRVRLVFLGSVAEGTQEGDNVCIFLLFLVQESFLSVWGLFFYLFSSTSLYGHHETTLNNYQGYALAVGHHHNRNQHSAAEVMNPKRNFHWAPLQNYTFHDE